MANVLEFVKLCLERMDQSEWCTARSDLEGLIDGDLLEPVGSLDAQSRVRQSSNLARLEKLPFAQEF